MATVVGVFTSPARKSGRSDAHDSRRAIAGQGLEGCAHANPPRREVLFVSKEHLDSVSVEPGAVRVHGVVSHHQDVVAQTPDIGLDPSGPAARGRDEGAEGVLLMPGDDAAAKPTVPDDGRPFPEHVRVRGSCSVGRRRGFTARPAQLHRLV